MKRNKLFITLGGLIVSGGFLLATSAGAATIECPFRIKCDGIGNSVTCSGVPTGWVLDAGGTRDVNGDGVYGFKAAVVYAVNEGTPSQTTQADCSYNFNQGEVSIKRPELISAAGAWSNWTTIVGNISDQSCQASPDACPFSSESVMYSGPGNFGHRTV